MKNLSVILGFGFILASLTASAVDEKKDFNLVETCKKDCPTAKTDEEAHKCAEKMGRLNKSFKKSKCWEVNEQYEAATTPKTTQ